MSEPKLISPLLDGFVMGDPISSHDGVRCCPAMRVSDESRYIVKIISVPASQTKLDALLLAGAFSTPESALKYFHELSRDTVEEAVLLQRLSRLEGFVSYESWQIVPMEEETGYDVYLLAPYRPTLERHFRKNAMTHLEAVNLGLDLCAALTASRRSGYLYVDLQPGNVCICDREYRVCDLGFISLSSLAYASLPEKYHSDYTAPEITDAYSALNDTLDIYAAGLILYQAYNGGLLPEGTPGDRAPEYADAEMAEIILKACAAEPNDRWQDPAQMGQALVSYMQRNGVEDTPIIPVPAEEPEPADEEPAAEEAQLRTEDVLAEVDQALEAAVITEYAPDEAELSPAEEETEEISAEEISAEEASEEIPSEAAAEELPEEPQPDTPEPEDAETEEDTTPNGESDTGATETAEDDETNIISAPLPPEEGSADWEDALVSEEIGQIMEQADELIAHELPAPAVAPEPIDIPIPAPIVPEPEEPEVSEAPADAEEASAPEAEEAEEAEEPELPAEPAEAAEEPAPPVKRRHGGLIALAVVLTLLLLLGIGGYLFYNNYYIQPILGMQLEGSEDRLVVTLNTDTDNSLLTVYCTDTYGNTLKAPVQNNAAAFTGLSPDTHYKVYVQIEGFRKLIGTTTDTYTTAKQTVISGLTAVTGAEDGSVILNFTVQGPETSEWKVTWSCPGEDPQETVFTGHMVTVTGLTVGNTYTFRLEPTAELYVVGEDTLEYTASALVFAENLRIESFLDGTLTAVWDTPDAALPNLWTVRCYNDAGFDVTVTVEEPRAVFADLDAAAGYTVEVTASGMTQNVRTFVSANSVTVENIRVDDSQTGQITVSWDFRGTAPAGGWLLLYTADGYTEQQVVATQSTSATISPAIPGTGFTFTVQTADGSTVFGGTGSYEAPAAEAFSGYLVTAADFVFRMCRTPENTAWGQNDVPAADYTTTFAPGEKASFAIWLNHVYNMSDDEIQTLAVIRDAEGNVVSTLTVTRTWTDMWYKSFGKLDLSALPQAPGNYTIEIYFNEALVTTQSFTIA